MNFLFFQRFIKEKNMLFSPTPYYQIEKLSTNFSGVNCLILYIVNSWVITLKIQIDVTRCHLERKNKERLFEEKHTLSVKIQSVHCSFPATHLM